MAQNITLMGASYSDVPAVELPKTGGGTATFTDTSDANASASDILTGKTAYVNGVKLTGTGSGGAVTSVNGRTGDVTGLAEEITIENKSSSDTVVTLEQNKFYIFPEMSTLAVTVTSSGMYMFRFTSGTTATTFTLTGAVLPDWFSVLPNKVYEVNVYQGYAVVTSWTTS